MDWCSAKFPGFWGKEDTTRLQSGPISDRKSLVDDQGRTQRADVGQLREDPLPERPNVMAEFQGRDSWQSLKGETLDNPICVNPERMREYIRLKWGYFGKIMIWIQVFFLLNTMK